MSRYALPLSGYENASIWGYDDQAFDLLRAAVAQHQRQLE